MNCPRCQAPLRSEMVSTHLMRADGLNVPVVQAVLVCNCGYARFDFPSEYKAEGEE